MMDMTSPRGQAMMSYLSQQYINSFMADLNQVRGLELDTLREALAEILDQFFARTATWDLSKWEYELGLPDGSGILMNSERQDRIVAKKSGYGTAKTSLIREVAESYEKGAVYVIEDFAAYTMYIKFIDMRGIPSNLSDLQAVLRELVQAHLEIVYLFTYLIYRELAASGLTYDQVKAAGITYDQFSIWKLS